MAKKKTKAGKAPKKKKRKQSPKQKAILKAFRTCYKEGDVCPLTQKLTKGDKQKAHDCAREKLKKQKITIKEKKY